MTSRTATTSITAQPRDDQPLLHLDGTVGPSSEEVTDGPACGNGLSCCLAAVLCLPSLGISMLSSFVSVKTQTEAVVLRYGRYEQTKKEAGLYWINSMGREVRTISTQLQSMDLPLNTSSRRTVLDANGNPLIVSAVCVFQIVDSYKAAVVVSQPVNFVSTQGECVLKNVVSRFTYEQLQHDNDAVNMQLRRGLQELVNEAGVRIAQFTLKEVSYSSVIAAAMLKKQQAMAIIEARERIVSGAVDIATSAVNSLRERNLCMSEEEATRLVTNLLTVICAESDVQPTMPLKG